MAYIFVFFTWNTVIHTPNPQNWDKKYFCHIMKFLINFSYILSHFRNSLPEHNVFSVNVLNILYVDHVFSEYFCICILAFQNGQTLSGHFTSAQVKVNMCFQMVWINKFFPFYNWHHVNNVNLSVFVKHYIFAFLRLWIFLAASV